MKILQTPAVAVGLAFIISVFLTPSSARAAKPSGNVVYVDNVNGDDTNPGTAAQPKATIQAGEDAAELLYGNDGSVVVRGGGPAYVESVYVSSSMAFFGNKMKGKPAQSLPVVQGGFYASGIGAITVTGFDIQGGLVATPVSANMIPSAGTAVFMENVGTGTVTGNKIGNGAPILMAGIWSETSQGSSLVSITENEITAFQWGVYVYGSAGSMNANVAKNDVSGTQNGPAIAVTIFGNSVGNFTLAENTVLHSLDGFNLSTYGEATAQFTVNKNLVSGTFMMAGMSMAANQYSSANFSVTSNVVEENSYTGIAVMAGEPGTSINAFLSGNTVVNNGGDQITGYGVGTLNFISDGARNNDVRETPGSPNNLYNSTLNTENGFILINRDLHPANEDLP